MFSQPQKGYSLPLSISTPSDGTSTRTTKDAQALMQQAYDRTGKIPRVIYTDGLKAYLDGIELTFGSETRHAVGGPFDVEDNTNRIERFHSTLKSRTKVMRGLDSFESARLFLDGWLVHYNFFRPHMSLNDLTPAQAAGIRFPFRNWKDILEQPYEVTARIPVHADDFRRHKAVKKVTRRKSRQARPKRASQPGVTSIRQLRKQT